MFENCPFFVGKIRQENPIHHENSYFFGLLGYDSFKISQWGAIRKAVAA
jgi:hypothetical protein